MKTWNAKPNELEKRWYVVDADGNIVDLKALDAELNPAASISDLVTMETPEDES